MNKLIKQNKLDKFIEDNQLILHNLLLQEESCHFVLSLKDSDLDIDKFESKFRKTFKINKSDKKINFVIHQLSVNTNDDFSITIMKG